jgi:hypothetical protein
MDEQLNEQPDDPTSSDALNHFLNGVEKKMESDFGMISSQAEKREAMRQIAQDLDLEDDYVPPTKARVNEDEETFAARWKVQMRYTELLEEGEIREDPEWDDPAKELNRRLNRYLEGEDTIYSHVDNEV